MDGDAQGRTSSRGRPEATVPETVAGGASVGEGPSVEVGRTLAEGETLALGVSAGVGLEEGLMGGAAVAMEEAADRTAGEAVIEGPLVLVTKRANLAVLTGTGRAAIADTEEADGVAAREGAVGSTGETTC